MTGNVACVTPNPVGAQHARYSGGAPFIGMRVDFARPAANTGVLCPYALVRAGALVAPYAEGWGGVCAGTRRAETPLVPSAVLPRKDQ